MLLTASYSRGTLDLSATESLHVKSLRWRHENYFRFTREHFALDAHDPHQAAADDTGHSVSTPAKEQAKKQRDVLPAKFNTLLSVAQAQELALTTPKPGEPFLVTYEMLNDVNAPVIKVEKQLAAANEPYKKTPVRLPWVRSARGKWCSECWTPSEPPVIPV